MLRFCIVEDDGKTGEALEGFVERSCAEHAESASVRRYGSAEAFLEACDATDVVFMDIELPGMDGMEAAKALRERDKKVLLIFVTNLAQYAVNGYEVGAFDFIVKPVNYGNFALKMRRVYDFLATRRKRELVLSTRQGKRLVNAETLKYVEIMKHVVSYHTEEGVVVASGSLKSVAELLDGLSFAMCNRCYLVNLHYVTQISGTDVTVGGEVLQISQPRRKEFLQAFNEFLALGGGTK